MNLLKEKKRIRSELKKKRNSINKEQRNQKSQKITNFLYETDEFQYFSNIFCYISHINEVETHPLINSILERNIDLFVPKIINSAEMIAIKLDNLSNLEPDNIGILTPKSGEILSEAIDIAVTPGLGFTKKGERMGYGRGYYDRWFSKNNVKTKIGFAFEEQIVKDLPLETTDVSMDIIITDKKIINLKSKL